MNLPAKINPLPVNINFDHERNHPYCNVCKRPVEEFGWETPVEIAHSWTGVSAVHHTGEVIVTVRCHGEVFRISNFRGVLS